MITYKKLFEWLKEPTILRFKSVPDNERIRVLKMLQILIHAEIAVYDSNTKVVSLHPKQIKPALVVLPTAPETAPIPKTVQVNWSRGFSGAKYDVLGYGVSNGKRYYAINNSTDEHKPMIKRVWANDCQVGIEKVAIAQEKAAA